MSGSRRRLNALAEGSSSAVATGRGGASAGAPLVLAGDDRVRVGGFDVARRRRPRRDGTPPPDDPDVEVTVLLDLLEASCTGGASIPRALAAVGSAAGGSRGAALVRAAGQLVLGSRWDEAWRGCPDALEPVAAALRSAWEEGTAPAAALRRSADTVRRARHARAMEAANRLGVRLVLPLGLCHLPAFVLVGLVPVLMSMARGVLP